MPCCRRSKVKLKHNSSRSAGTSLRRVHRDAACRPEGRPEVCNLFSSHVFEVVSVLQSPSWKTVGFTRRLEHSCATVQQAPELAWATSWIHGAPPSSVSLRGWYLTQKENPVSCLKVKETRQLGFDGVFTVTGSCAMAPSHRRTEPRSVAVPFCFTEVAGRVYPLLGRCAPPLQGDWIFWILQPPMYVL